MKTDLEQRRSDWLKEAKKLVMAVLSRQAALEDACPQFQSDDDRQEALKRAAVANEQITAHCERLHEIETSGAPLLGAAACGITGNEILRVAFTLMVMARLGDDLSRQTRDVASIVDLAGSRDPDTALEIRSAFRSDTGILRPLVEMRLALTLDECDITIKERIFNAALGMRVDAEMEACDHVRNLRFQRRMFA
jgi:hypothetical protein